MTIGIYCLKFKGTDKVYIGQSCNIERRFKQHLNSIKNNTANKKIQEVYEKYGYPSLLVLTECSLDELDFLEEEAICLYNSANEGLNIYEHANEAPSGRYGEDAGASKFSNKQIIEAFFMLIGDTYYPATDISFKTGVSVAVVMQISCGGLHRWLQDKYPDEYKVLQEKKGTRHTDAINLISQKLGAKNLGITYPKIKSPKGEVFEIENAYRFAKERGLAGNHFQEVLNGHRKSHKGWKICPPEQV